MLGAVHLSLLYNPNPTSLAFSATRPSPGPRPILLPVLTSPAQRPPTRLEGSQTSPRADPSSPSPGTCCSTRTQFADRVRLYDTRMGSNAARTTASASSKPSAKRSPRAHRRTHPSHRPAHHGLSRLRCAPPGISRLPVAIPFRIDAIVDCQIRGECGQELRPGFRHSRSRRLRALERMFAAGLR